MTRSVKVELPFKPSACGSGRPLGSLTHGVDEDIKLPVELAMPLENSAQTRVGYALLDANGIPISLSQESLTGEKRWLSSSVRMRRTAQ
jgi:hypothetical protein